MFKNILKKIENHVTKVKPMQTANPGKYTVQIYPDGTTTIGIKTGKKPGPHYGGKGNIN